MKLLDLQLSQSDGDAMVAAQFLRQHGHQHETLIISVPERFHHMLRDSRDVFLPVLMLPCMKTGEPLDLDGAVSGGLLDQVHAIQEVYLSWFPCLKPVEVIATRAVESHARASGVGAFFSGGVDSFHTLRQGLNGKIRGIDRLSHLVFVRSTAGQDFRGFGLPLPTKEMSAASEVVPERIANATQTTLVRVDTNIQRLFSDFNWSLYHHGAGLASIALALSRVIGTQIISSGWSYHDLHPWGSHPLTDPLWSTEYLRVLHYGNHVTRAEKIVTVIAHDELALEHLRVCNYNSSVTNCGRCYKCLRTMIPLDMVGKLSAAHTFPSTVPDDISAAFNERGALEDDAVYRLARKLGHDVYVRRIEKFIKQRQRRQAVRQFLEASPALAGFVRPLRRARRWVDR
jgi:hypothetical protein